MHTERFRLAAPGWAIILRPLRGLGLLLETVWKSDERCRAHYTWN